MKHSRQRGPIGALRKSTFVVNERPKIAVFLREHDSESRISGGTHKSSSFCLPTTHPSSSLKGTFHDQFTSSSPLVESPDAESLSSTLQTLTVLSLEPEATYLPSCEKAMDQIQPVCPTKGSKTSCPLATCHTFTVQSREPEAICDPSGEKAIERTASE